MTEREARVRYRWRRRWIRWHIMHSPKELRLVMDEKHALWQRALEREQRLTAAVADVVWKATPFGEREDGSIAAYLVPSGCMHRLVGVAQQNGAHVPVAFRDIARSRVGVEREDGK